MKKFILPVSLSLFALWALSGCGAGDDSVLSPEELESSLQERQSGTNSDSWQNAALVSAALAQSKAVRINLRTNYATYYEGGAAKTKWKVASAKAGHATPRGIFKIHSKADCPSWNNGEGLSAAPCAANNPLGRKALWFHEGTIYGMHGVDKANVGSVTAANARDRDRSKGCVRNHPNNIEWLFARVSVGTPVVVGSWDADPAVNDCSGKAQCDLGGGGPATPSRLPSSLPAWCAINVSAGTSVANVRAQPNTSASIIDSLRREAKVRLEQSVVGASVSGSTSWYKVSYTLGGAKSGFLHSSLIDCTR